MGGEKGRNVKAPCRFAFRVFVLATQDSHRQSKAHTHIDYFHWSFPLSLPSHVDR